MSWPGLARNRLAAGVAFALPVGAVGILAADTSRAEGPSGQTSAYTALSDDDVASCVAYSPLFVNNVNGKTSTLVLHNAANQGSTVGVRIASLSGDPVINREISLGANATVELGPSFRYRPTSPARCAPPPSPWGSRSLDA